MQKFCISTKWLEKGGCKNSVQPYFLLNSLLYLQQMYDAEILHLNLTAEQCMLTFCIHKFCTIVNEMQSKTWKIIIHLHVS